MARWHRWMGLALSAPLVAWIASALAMHLIVHDAPNGLQGVYDLNPVNSVVRSLDEAQVTPSAILDRVTEHGIDRVYALRLESHGSYLLYALRPTPYALTLTFDAMTGERMDPLPDSVILAIASEHLAGTHATRVLEDVREYHRDYDLPWVPAARIVMSGSQPSELILSRDNGRPLRRLDAVATGFEAWYRALHVFQWGGALGAFTAVLYGLTGAVVVLAVIGLMLWFLRRGKRRPAALVWHGRTGLVLGIFLVIEVVVGAYMWMSLGPLQDPFRGKNTFATQEQGMTVADSLASPPQILGSAQTALGVDPSIVQAIEWRVIGDRPAWGVRTTRNEVGTAFAAATGRVWQPAPAVIGEAVRNLMKDRPSFEFEGEGEYYWNDVNRPVPVYHYRFADGTDVYASRTTGEIVSRRTGFWRAFTPFLMIHSVAFSADSGRNALYLYLMLAAFAALVVTGWWAWWRTR